MKQRLTTYLGARIEPRVRIAFTKKAKAFGGNSVVIQELITGFVEDRVTIKPPTTGIYAINPETKGN